MDDKEQFIESFEVDNIEEESNKTQKKKRLPISNHLYYSNVNSFICFYINYYNTKRKI
jgi:hypothetical protein